MTRNPAPGCARARTAAALRPRRRRRSPPAGAAATRLSAWTSPLIIADVKWNQPVNLRENIAIILAGAVLVLGLAQAIHPFSRRMQPMLMFLIALLLALRWLLRRQARKRAALIEKVPERPLGIGDDSPRQ